MRAERCDVERCAGADWPPVECPETLTFPLLLLLLLAADDDAGVRRMLLGPAIIGVLGAALLTGV